MRIRRKGKRPDDLISAHEIACWAYCPEQWRLQYGLGMPAANGKALAVGDRHHASKAAAERGAGLAILVGRLLVVISLLALLLIVVSSR